jgi:anti-sigma28 factor (negative regulator of flagellin synthesis)
MTWGDNPIDDCPRRDDATHMTVLDTRYESRDRMTGPARDSGRRFARSSTSLPPKDGAVNKVQELRERIQCGTYAVDSDAVAAAILKRLLDNHEEAPVSHWRN